MQWHKTFVSPAKLLSLAVKVHDVARLEKLAVEC